MTSLLMRSPMSGRPFIAIMSRKLAPFGMTTAGAKSSLSPYLSETYLMKSMNRT